VSSPVSSGWLNSHSTARSAFPPCIWNPNDQSSQNEYKSI
jgi:hypothetical protein